MPVLGSSTVYGAINPAGMTNRVVGTRPPNAYTTTGAGNSGQNGRLKDVIAADCADLRLVYASPLWLEQDGVTAAPIFVAAGLELTVNGTIIPVTFGGRIFGRLDNNGILVSDPIPGEFPKGTVVYYRTWSGSGPDAAAQFNGTTTNGSPTVTVNSVAYGKIVIGSTIFGAGLPGFVSKVTSVSTDGLTVTCDTNATSTATATMTAALATGQVTHSAYADGNEVGQLVGSTNTPNLSLTGTLTGADGNTSGPVCVLADRIYGAPTPVVGLFGDSITFGTGWTASGYASKAGTSYGVIALGGNYPYINFGHGSETPAQAAAIATSYRRRKLWAFCTHGIVMYGTNAISSQTMAQHQVNLLSIWTSLARYGIKAWACTILPQASSTDSFTTTVNQTKTLDATHEGYRTGLNDWIRDGAPILAGVAVATGSNATGTLRAGNTNHPLAGYFETAGQVESARNSGIWVPNMTYLGDGGGVHPNNAGHTAIATAIDPTKFV